MFFQDSFVTLSPIPKCTQASPMAKGPARRHSPRACGQVEGPYLEGEGGGPLGWNLC